MTKTIQLNIPPATPTAAGLMTARHSALVTALESQAEHLLAYGVEWDSTSPSTTLRRIGNMRMHRGLPIQSGMRGCLLNDRGEVTAYLPSGSWTSATRNGTAGQVMVEIPQHYRKFETDGDIYRVWLSDTALNGYHLVPKVYVSAYPASVQRSTGKLCSVVNSASNYRGGNNNSAWDGTYRSLLGRPCMMTREAARTAARKRYAGTKWNVYTYDIHKAVYWLFTVEYATLNCQLDFNPQPTPDGYRQGGLGIGGGVLNSTTWNSFNSRQPFVSCGHTDALGNGSGAVPFAMPTEYSTAGVTYNVPRYRGIEQPFDPCSQWLDGINVVLHPTRANGGDDQSEWFVCSDPAKFGFSASAASHPLAGYRRIATVPNPQSYVTDILFGDDGDIIPCAYGGSSTTYYCDDMGYNNLVTANSAVAPRVDGTPGGYRGGFLSLDLWHSPAGVSFCNRLTYIP